MSADEVRAEVSAEAVPDTVLLRATVTDGSADRALALTRSLATQFAALVATLETPPGGTAPSVRVETIAGPRVAAAPVAPRPARNLGLGFVLGLLLGIGAAVLREALDTTVKTVATLTDTTGVPVLSTVPHDPRARNAPLIIEGSVRSTRAEALRQLRTNLRFVDVDRSTRSMVVTSACPGEGKSTTACNLAIVLAEAGKRVVLVDADLRRPRLAEYLDLEGAIGLTNVLAGQVEVRTALQHWGDSGVFVLASGSVPPNPSELLGSNNMADLLAALTAAFDVVIIDTPPLLPVTDAAVLASAVDGTLLVSRHGHTTVSQARQAADALRAVEARILGTVLNMAPARRHQTYSYYEEPGTLPEPAGTPSEEDGDETVVPQRRTVGAGPKIRTHR
jgi:capsular exopolysaccharide synthesis family protein